MRINCVDCNYPINTCICSAIQRQETYYKIIIIQHYKEAKHAKNTARLAKLCIPELSILAVQDDNDIDNVINQIANKKSAIFYINKCSRVLENNVQSFQKEQYELLIFIDGSWKQSKGIYSRLMQRLTTDTWEINNTIKNSYYIRKSPFAKSLSTLEAIAHTIECVESLDVSPLYRALTAFQNTWQGPQRDAPNK